MSVNEEIKITVNDEIVDDDMFGHIQDEKAQSPIKYQSMQPKLPKVIELYHDSRKSTFIFKDEDEEPKQIPRMRGLTQRDPDLKLSNFGMKKFDNSNVIQEEEEN